ncbi:MucR family transcriptional regulator [Methylobacterium durans]|uniref:MucR family transcriptional regulator n=1 Tax=Methylobacterium durans TaxID=2202825 RepID=A0A2U8WFG0_9HYPH|nr:MucR family transcriptional regulator [Methylobacterium durans]AWN44012.1 MucR family transcriptional regulator [Methylobacterium durans]
MDENIKTQGNDYLELTSDIISAYVANNSVRTSDLPSLIAQVHSALAGLGNAGTTTEPAVEKLTPAQIKKSISHDALISFEDGKPYKTLKRHLTIRGLTPEAYRAKYGLPRDYPMVAASYSEQRSSLAKSLGLGQQRRKPATKAADVAETVSDAPKGRGGRKKASASTGAPAKSRSRKKVAEAAE